MDFTYLIIAFGGGLLASMVGAINSFIFVSVVAIAAILGGAAGAPAIGLIAFGPVFGPHVAFAGAVAAAAFAMTRNHLENGSDIVTPLNKFGDPTVLIVGGIFGMIGYLLDYILSDIVGSFLFTGLLGDNATGWTDSIALSILISAFIVRLVFGKTGLTGKFPEGEKRTYFPTGSRLGFLIVMGLGLGILFGGVVVALGTFSLETGSAEVTYLFNMMPLLAFALGGFGLLFIVMGIDCEAWFHISYPATTTAVILFSANQNSVAAIIGAVVAGIVSALLGALFHNLLDTNVDTHINAPVCSIVVVQTINFLIIGGLITPALM
ncbi:MAG: hypothetical protein PHO29_00560 [Acetobacterium sp.]|nr:hypothetical protein [Acetobacterium sp.]